MWLQPVTPESATGVRSVPRRRWGIALLLGFGVLVNYFDRVNLSVSQEALHNAFGISTVTFGYLLSAYSWTYAALQLPSGLILDRFGVKLVGRIGAFLWSVASFAAAISTGLWGFLGARLLLGVGEAPTFPGNAKAVGYWFPREERSLATAIFDSAAKLASAIGVPLLGLLLLRFGWRWSFAATGFISLLYFVVFYLFYRNPSEDKSLSAAERDFIQHGGAQPEDRVRAAKAAPIGYLLRQRKVWGLVLGSAAYNYTFYLLLTWMPSYLSSTHHIDLLHSALYTSIPWLLATFADLVMGGWLVDRLVRRGRDASLVRQTILIAGTVLGVGVLGAAYAQSITTALVWISLAIGGLSAASPVGWSIPSLIAPRESVGTLGGILNFGNQLSAIAAPIATGYIAQTTHSFFWAFGAAAAFLMVGIAAYMFLLGRIEAIPEPV
ncbi:MAG TPA: MFS transporter [Verrucomicrobiae bacterium]|jgi:ACS family D-galactonate transporter-like MFS transporter|nr:MFS transporter [Verrucomicrobiae bacterium]